MSNMLKDQLILYATLFLAFALMVLLPGYFILKKSKTIDESYPPYSDHAVLHHTAGSKETARDLSAAEIDIIHKENGWDGCGYHFVIRKDGTVENGRSLSKQGAHAKGRNHFVGIALTGYDEFTKEQIRALLGLLLKLDIEVVERHHEDCPGPGLDVEEIQRTLDITLILK